MADEAVMVIAGTEYPLPDLNVLTYREAGIIKRISGVRIGELEAALDAGDIEVVAAFAIIAMRRAGVRVDEQQFLDGSIGDVELFVRGDDGGPPDGNGGTPPTVSGDTGSPS